MEELKSCPFCGSKEPFITVHIFKPNGLRFITCGKCGILTNFFQTEARAVEFWNRRSEQK